MTTMRVLIYARVSRDRSGEVRSVHEQVDDLRETAEREGWEVARVVTEEGSASEYRKRDRPAWAEVMAAVEAGAVDAVMVWEDSRATRDGLTWETFRRAAVDHDVRYIVGRTVYDLRDPDDDFHAGLNAQLSRRESGYISKRTRRAAAANAAAGLPHGRRQFGYRRIYDGAGRLTATVEDPESGPVVRRMFAEAAEGRTLRAIAAGLNDDHIPPRHPRTASWRPQAVKDVLTSPAYVGDRVHRGVVVGPAAWPALVDREVWERVQIRITHPGPPAPRGPEPVHLLSGIAVCGGCGGPLRGATKRQPTKADPDHRIHLLTCRNAHAGCVTISEHAADAWVTAAVVSGLSDTGFLTDAEDDADGVAARRAELQAELERLRAYLGEVEAAAAEALDAAMLARQTAIITPKIAAAEEELEGLSDVDPGVRRLASKANIQAAWEELPLEEKRRIIQALGTPVVLPASAGRTPEERIRMTKRR